MSKVVYKAPLDIYVHYSESRRDLLSYYVDAFEVDGGVTRKVELAGAEESVINCEFDDARTFKNITFYLKSSRFDSTSKLIDLAKSEVKHFTANFLVMVYEKAGRKMVRAINLISNSSRFLETPIPVGGTPPSLKIRLGLDSIELYRGAKNKDGKLELN